MDYQKTINSFFKIKSDYIIEKLNEYKAQSRPFEFAIDKVSLILSDERSNSLINSNRNLFNNCIYNFYQFDSLYQKGASISLVIENEIKLEFEKIKTQKIIDNNRNEVVNYSFEAFINDLIEYDSLGRIEARLRNNSELYKIFYETNNYDDFTLESFDGHVINSNLYRKLFSKNYPKKTIPIAVKRIDNFNNIIYDIIENQEELNNPSANQQVKSKINKHFFELDEQLLILNLCLEDRNSIPLTEKSKLIILIGEIIEDNLFNVSSSNSKTYSKISKGIFRKGSTETMILIINSILTKIEKYNLTKTEQTLKKHRTTLINEQKNI